MEEIPREKVNVAALRTVFFHSAGPCIEKRLPVIEEPSSFAPSQSTAVHLFIPRDRESTMGCDSERVDEK